VKSPAERQADVNEAALWLPAAVAAANLDPSDTALWAEVERLGAIVHRQARLLAGKPRGG
jgi:hypothetical protein